MLAHTFWHRTLYFTGFCSLKLLPYKEIFCVCTKILIMLLFVYTIGSHCQLKILDRRVFFVYIFFLIVWMKLNSRYTY